MKRSKLQQIIKIKSDDFDDDVVIKWNKLNKQQLIQIINDNLIKNYKNEFERNIIVNRIVELYLKTEEESIDKISDMNLGKFNYEFIVPIISDKKIIYIKKVIDNTIFSTSNTIQKEIIEFKKK